MIYCMKMRDESAITDTFVAKLGKKKKNVMM